MGTSYYTVIVQNAYAAIDCGDEPWDVYVNRFPSFSAVIAAAVCFGNIKLARQEEENA